MEMSKKDAKHFLYVGGLLCGFGAVAALLIGGAYVIANPLIEENRQKALEEALSVCFANDDDTFSDAVSMPEDCEYLSNYYIAYASGEEYGYIYQGSGSNTYGSVEIAVGLTYADGELVYGCIGVIENTESYKTTLENNYIAVFNASPSQESLNSISCGATFGAKLIRNIVNEAVEYYLNTAIPEAA